MKRVELPNANFSQTGELLAIVRRRIRHDKLWAAVNSGCAFLLTWIVILASCGSSIAAASGLSRTVTASLAAIPAIGVLLSQNLNLMGLSRWHHKLAAELQALERSLQFESMSLAAASEEYSRIMRQFEDATPPVNLVDRSSLNAKGQLKTRRSLRRTPPG